MNAPVPASIKKAITTTAKAKQPLYGQLAAAHSAYFAGYTVTSFKTLPEAINFWSDIARKDIQMQGLEHLSDINKNHLRLYLSKLTGTAEFHNSKRNSINLAHRIINVLSFITKDDIQDIAFTRIYNSLSSRDSGIILSLQDLEISQELHLAEKNAALPDATDDTLNTLIDIGKKMFYMDKIRQFASQKHQFANTKTHLAIQIGLTDRLTPPLNTHRMLYRAVSGVTAAEIDQAYDYIQEEYEANFETFLNEWAPWERHQRSLHVKSCSQLAEKLRPADVNTFNDDPEPKDNRETLHKDCVLVQQDINKTDDKLANLLLTDDDREVLVSGSYYNQLKLVNQLTTCVKECLDHKFAGNEQSFKIKKMMKSAAIHTSALAVTGGVAVAATTAMAATSGAVLVPAVASIIAADQAGLATVVLYSGYLGAVRGSHAYFIHEKKWFKYFVDKDHMELFLKENPEKEDIEALENIVNKINDKLADDNFKETFKSVRKALKFSKLKSHLKQELKEIGPDIFNIYLELARQRYAINQTACLEVDQKGEGQSVSSQENVDVQLPTDIQPSSSTDVTSRWSFQLEEMRTEGIDNPAFTENDN